MADRYRPPEGGAGAYAPAPPPPQIRTNSFAIASLVLGIVWIYWIGSILALVFGYVALRQIRRSNGWQQGRGLAIAGVVLGWIGAAMLALVVILGLAVANDTDNALDNSVDDPPETGVAGEDGPSVITTEFGGDGAPPQQRPEIVDREPPVPAPPAGDTSTDEVAIETLIPGDGPAADQGDTVVVHYVGVLTDGTVFDSSWQGGQAFTVVLGEGAVIAGWEEGLEGARAGERRRLVIGSSKAYGSTGTGVIPPDSPLAFEIDVFSVEQGGG